MHLDGRQRRQRRARLPLARLALATFAFAAIGLFFLTLPAHAELLLPCTDLGVALFGVAPDPFVFARLLLAVTRIVFVLALLTVALVAQQLLPAQFIVATLVLVGLLLARLLLGGLLLLGIATRRALADTEQPAPEARLFTGILAIDRFGLCQHAGLVSRCEPGNETDPTRARTSGVGGVAVDDPLSVDTLAADLPLRAGDAAQRADVYGMLVADLKLADQTARRRS